MTSVTLSLTYIHIYDYFYHTIVHFKSLLIKYYFYFFGFSQQIKELVFIAVLT